MIWIICNRCGKRKRMEIEDFTYLRFLIPPGWWIKGRKKTKAFCSARCVVKSEGKLKGAVQKAF